MSRILEALFPQAMPKVLAGTVPTVLGNPFGDYQIREAGSDGGARWAGSAVHMIVAGWSPGRWLSSRFRLRQSRACTSALWSHSVSCISTMSVTVR